MEDSVWLTLQTKVRKLVIDIIEPTIRRTNENRASVELVNRREQKTFQKLEELSVAVFKIERKFQNVQEYSKQLIEFSAQQRIFQGQFQQFKESTRQELEGLVRNVKEVQDGMKVLEHQRQHLRGEISKVNLSLSQAKGDLEQKINGTKLNQEEIYGVINAKTEDLTEKQVNFDKILKGLSQSVAQTDLHCKKLGFKHTETQKELENFKTEFKGFKTQNDYQLENINKNFSINLIQNSNEIKSVKEYLNSEFQIGLKLLWVNTLFFITTDQRSKRLLAQYQQILFADLYEHEISSQIFQQIQKILQKSKIILQTPIPPSPRSTKKRKTSSDSSQLQPKQFVRKQRLKQSQTEIEPPSLKNNMMSSLYNPVPKAPSRRNSRTPIQTEQSQVKFSPQASITRSLRPLTKSPRGSFKQHPSAPIKSPRIPSKLSNTSIRSPIISPKIPVAPKSNQQLVQTANSIENPKKKLEFQGQILQQEKKIKAQTRSKTGLNSFNRESKQNRPDSPSEIVLTSQDQKQYTKTLFNKSNTLIEQKNLTSQQSRFFSDSEHSLFQQGQFSLQRPDFSPLITEIQDIIKKIQNRLQTIQNKANSKFAQIQQYQITIEQNRIQYEKTVKSSLSTFQQRQNHTQNSLNFTVTSRLDQQNIYLKQSLDQLKFQFTQRKRQQSNIQSQLIRLNYRIQQDSQHRNQLQQTIEQSQKALQTIIEFSKISLQLQLQDQYDKQTISLYGYKENKVPRNNQRIKPIVSIDKQCISCNSQASVVLTAFKMACLAYHPSQVEYKASKFQRKELIEYQKQMIESI